MEWHCEGHSMHVRLEIIRVLHEKDSWCKLLALTYKNGAFWCFKNEIDSDINISLRNISITYICKLVIYVHIVVTELKALYLHMPNY